MRFSNTAAKEEEERQMLLEEQREKNKERIQKAYGGDAELFGRRSIRRRRHIYLFSPEDLDNDDIIAMVEDSVTYERDKTMLNKIKDKSHANTTEQENNTVDFGGVITF